MIKNLKYFNGVIKVGALFFSVEKGGNKKLRKDILENHSPNMQIK